MYDLSDKKIGLVLSGGGAKGAYQIGMLRALEEAGLDKRNLYLAGTSIGALTALVYSVKNTDAIRMMMQGFGKALAAVKAELGSGGTFGAQDGKGQQGSEFMMKALEQLLPDELLENNPVPVTACCYSLHKERPEYFALNDLAPSEQRKLVIASASIPGIYPPVEYKGDEYLDGGAVPPGMKDPAPADKIPAAALKQIPLDIEFISYLKPEDSIAPEAVHPTALSCELRPSRPLEDRPHAGTLDFSPEKLEAHEKLGYEDTIRVLENLN